MTGLVTPHATWMLACCLLVASVETTPQTRAEETKRNRTDNYGDPLPQGALARLGTVRWRHGSYISRVAFSPDGKTLVSGSPDGQVLLWQVATGRQIRRFKGHGASIMAVVFSPDGTMVASCSGVESEQHDNTVRLWDIATGKELHCLKGHERGVTIVAFSPDSKTLASGSADFSIRLWEIESGQMLRQFKGHQACVNSVTFSPDGNLLASGGRDNKGFLWDLDSLKPVQQWDFSGGIRHVAFSPDGKILVSAGHERIRLREVDGGKEIANFSCVPIGDVLQASFCPDGKSLIYCGEAGAPLSQLDIKSGKQRKLIEQAYRDWVSSFAVSPDGKTVATSEWGMIPLWDLATGKPLNFFGGHTSQLYALAVSPNGETVATASHDVDKAVRIWQIATGKQVLELSEQSVTVAVAFSPDGKTLATGSYDGDLVLWDAATGKKLSEAIGNASDVKTLVFSPDGRRIASGGWLHESINFWEPKTGKRSRDWAKHPEAVLALAFSPDGKVLASGGRGPEIRFWDVATAKEIRTCTGQTGSVTSLAFSPDGRILASATAAENINGIFLGTEQDNLIRLWDAATGNQRTHFKGSGNGFSCLAFSPDGRSLASADDRNLIQLWEVATGQQRADFAGHSGPISAVAFTPNGRMLVSASCDTTALLWDLRSPTRNEPPIALASSRQVFERLWDDLAAADSRKSWQAIKSLIESPENAIPLLKKHLKRASDEKQKRIHQFVADLDDEQFSKREAAFHELAKLLPEAESSLRKALEEKPSLEFRRRVERLLALDLGIIRDSELLRGIRAIEALESMGSPEARELLKDLALGGSEARLTQEAKASLERLNNQGAVAP
jgi:WD40 repeat protein